MLNGGYKIIDLKDANLTAVDTQVKGVYESIENSYRKAILLSGIVIDGVERNDAFVQVVHGTNVYTCSLYGKTLTISSEDNLKVE